MVTPAIRTTAVLLVFSNLTNMFSFAMTSDRASDSDKFKIIMMLRRAQKFRDSGPYEKFDFLYNPLMTKVSCDFSRNLASFKKNAKRDIS